MSKKIRVLFCGQSSFPQKNSAAANRYRAIADALNMSGCEIIFVNKLGIFSNTEILNFIDYKCLWPSGIVRSNNFLTRNIKKLIAPVNEFVEIFREDRKNKIKYLNIYTEFFHDAFIYFVIGIVLEIKCIVHLVEVRSSIPTRSIFLKINDWLFEKFVPILFNKFIAISEKTSNLIVDKSKVFILPPVCNFDEINAIDAVGGADKYFLYCASMEYEDVAWFVIQSYLATELTDTKLYMVLNGQLSDRIIDIQKKFNKNIKIFTKIPYSELINFYKNSLALLIPLRNTIQDTARFPQKITEYLASGRPIITTNHGEVAHYFIDQVNALVADEYSICAFAKKMSFAAASSEEVVDQIADAGRALGRAKFDYRAYSINLVKFLN